MTVNGEKTSYFYASTETLSLFFFCVFFSPEIFEKAVVCGVVEGRGGVEGEDSFQRGSRFK